MTQCRFCGSPLEESLRTCTVCGSPVEPAPERSRATPAQGGGSPTRRIARILIPVGAVGAVLLLWIYLNPSVHQVIRDQPVVESPAAPDSTVVKMKPVAFRIDGDDIVLSLDDVLRNRLVRFEYAGEATTRPVLAYVARDGHLVTAVSVSEHCGSTEFVLQGDRINCARCPSSWDMLTLEAFACCARYYPDPIPSRVDGGEVRISRKDVEGWAGRL